MDNVLKRCDLFAELESECLIAPLDARESDGHLVWFDCHGLHLGFGSGRIALGGLRLSLCAILYGCLEAAQACLGLIR